MAIYRPTRPRWPLGVAAFVAGLALGAAAGYAAGDKEPDPLEAARRARTSLVAAAGGLEVAAIEYEEAVQGGRVVSEPEFRGARSALMSSRMRFEEVRPALEIIAPERAAALSSSYDTISSAMRRRAQVSAIGAEIDKLRAALAP